MVKRVIGTVKWFSPAKGYGIIAQDEGPDVYVHREALQKIGAERLYRGQEIKFTFAQIGEKYQVRNISFAQKCSGIQKRSQQIAALDSLDGEVTLPPKKRG